MKARLIAFWDPERQAKFRRRTMLFLATGAFTGYSPVAPGTVGTLAGVLLMWSLSEASHLFRLVLTFFLGAAGVWAAFDVGKRFRVVDSPKIVVDEIVGLMVTMIGIPVTGYWLACGFLLFRIFDIVKFPPANWFDSKVKNGWGVMADDIVSGIYCNIILRLMLKTAI